MIVLQQRLFGVFRYRRAYFPSEAEVESLLRDLGTNDILRFYLPAADRPASPQLVDRFSELTLLIDLAQGPDALFMGMRRDGRYRIRQAQRLADRMRIDSNSKVAREDFFELYNSFARSKPRVPILSRRAFEVYASISDIWVIYLDDAPMCAHLNLKDEGSKQVIGVFAAGRRLETGVNPEVCSMLNRYLFWWEFQEYCRSGFRSYDFGGLHPHSPRITPYNQFKLSFGGQIVHQHCYTFSGTRRLAQLGVNLYFLLRSSRAARLLRQL